LLQPFLLCGKSKKGGDIPEEAIKKLSTRLEIKIKIPDAGPKAAKMT
jgi:hypothetical protein